MEVFICMSTCTCKHIHLSWRCLLLSKSITFTDIPPLVASVCVLAQTKRGVALLMIIHIEHFVPRHCWAEPHAGFICNFTSMLTAGSIIQVLGVDEQPRKHKILIFTSSQSLRFTFQETLWMKNEIFSLSGGFVARVARCGFFCLFVSLRLQREAGKWKGEIKLACVGEYGRD